MSNEEKKIDKFSNRENTKFFIFFEWLSKLIILNMYIIVFATAGLVVFGFGPAILAGQKVFLKWKNDEHPELFKTFWTEYKSHFFIGSILFITCILFIFLMVFNLLYFYYNIEPSLFRTLGIFGNFFFIFLTILGFTFTNLFKQKFEVSNMQAINLSIRYIWAYPKQLLTFLLSIIVLGIGFYLFPQFFMFVSFSIYVAISVIVFENSTKHIASKKGDSID